MKIPAITMDFFFSWIWQMMLNPCIPTRSMRKQNMKNLVRDWLERLSISPFFLPNLARVWNLLIWTEIYLYLVMVSFPTNSTEALLFPCEEVVGADGMGMEWALLSHKMRKSLELVPDVWCPRRDRGLFFVSKSDPDAFTLLGWLFRVCHVHKSPALGDLGVFKENPMEQLASTLLKDTLWRASSLGKLWRVCSAEQLPVIWLMVDLVLLPYASWNAF